MSSNYDLRSALADALPAAGPTRAAVKAMDDIGYKADPQNNDMKELFVGLDLATSGSSSGKEAQPAASLAVAAASGEEGAAAAAVAAEPAEIRAGSGGGPSAAQALLDYRRERKAAQEAADLEAATLSAAGKGKGPGTAVAAAPGIGGVGLARATELASLEMEEAADDERLLKKRNLSKTAARMSSKQKRRRKNGKEHGTTYEDKHAGKVVNKSKRKGRMLAMKQMY